MESGPAPGVMQCQKVTGASFCGVDIAAIEDVVGRKNLVLGIPSTGAACPGGSDWQPRETMRKVSDTTHVTLHGVMPWSGAFL